MSKTIKFYIKSQYGHDREFVHPDNAAEGRIIAQLTGQKTLNPAIRALLEQLGGVRFEQVLPPQN